MSVPLVYLGREFMIYTNKNIVSLHSSWAFKLTNYFTTYNLLQHHHAEDAHRKLLQYQPVQDSVTGHTQKDGNLNYWLSTGAFFHACLPVFMPLICNFRAAC